MQVLYYGDYELLAYDVIDSTQTEAKRRLSHRPRHRQVIWAQRQTAGIGRSGRTWKSSDKASDNLHMTLLWKLKRIPRYPGRYSFAAAMALHDTLAHFAPDPKNLQVKWPNDLLYHECKIGGILLEIMTDAQGHPWLLAGIGANIYNAPQVKDRETICLLDRAETDVEIGSVLAVLLDRIDKRMKQLARGRFRKIREDWLAHVYGFGDPITARLLSRTVEGRFSALGKRGELVLTEDDGTEQIIYSGEVFFERG